MDQNENQQKLEAMAEQGIVDDNLYDHDDVVATQKAQAEAAAAPDNTQAKTPTYFIKQKSKDENGQDIEVDIEVRDITLRVPVDVTDTSVQAAWQMGMAAVVNAKRGVMTIVFPHAKDDGQGNMIPTLARKDCFLAKPEDVMRVLKLADTITHVNLEVASVMAQQPGNAIEAAKRGTTMKDNTTSDLVAQAKGQAGGIIIAGK